MNSRLLTADSPHPHPCHSVSQMLWLSFAVVWDMALFDLTSSAVEEALYLSCDFGAKVRNTCLAAGPSVAPLCLYPARPPPCGVRHFLG